MGYKQHIKKVSGKRKKEILLFALSTCGWCKKTKELLNSLGVEYEYVDVDLLKEENKQEVFHELKKRGTTPSFPKIFINTEIISGFDEESIKKVLK